MSFQLLSQSGECEELRFATPGGERLSSDQTRTLTEIAEDEFHHGFVCGMKPRTSDGLTRREKRHIKRRIYQDFVARSAFGFLALMILKTIIYAMIEMIYDYYFNQNNPAYLYQAIERKKLER